MDPITWVVVGVLAAMGAGFGAGWGVRGSREAAALEAHGEVLEALTDGQRELLEAAQRPVILDASIRADLSQVPFQCRADQGGDPMSPACAWATCLQYGQSSAQRPECREVEAAMVSRFQEDTSSAPSTPPTGSGE